MEQSELVIIGSGPAGYTAALYAARAQLQPIIFTGVESGGQLMYTTNVENYPGYPEGIQGPQLMQSLRSQAERFGAQVRDQQVIAVDFSARPFKLWTNLPEGFSPEIYKQGDTDKINQVINQVKNQPPALTTKAVVIATGATAIRLNIPGEKELMGKGVSTCAVCDAAFFKDKQVYVIGGGDSAMEDSLALAKFTDRITLIHRRDQFRASKIMQERVLNHDHIKVMWNSEVQEVIGQDKVESIKVKTAAEVKELPADGMFLAIGHRPVTDIFQNQLLLDEKRYLVTRQSITKLGVEQARQALTKQGIVAYPTMTSVEGIFAGGDVVDVRYRQAITAAGQGCAAAIDAERWLETR